MRRSILLALALLLACAKAGDGSEPSSNSDSEFKYVIDGIHMPGSAAEADQMGFDLDGDASGKPDNHLGVILSQLFTSNIADMNAEVAALIDSGAILHLLEIRGRGIEGRQVVDASLWVGHDLDGNADNNFSGQETFSIEITNGEPLEGFVNEGVLEVGPGSVALKLGLPGGSSPVLIDLAGAHIKADVGLDSMEGRVGGAVTKADTDEKLIPFVQEAVQHLIEKYCDVDSCEPESTGEFFLELFDVDGDRTVSLAEVRGHAIVETLTKPDVDLFDENGEPGRDGVADSLSLAVGITAVSANF